MEASTQGQNAILQAIEQDPENSRWQRNKYFFTHQQFQLATDLTIDNVMQQLNELLEQLNAPDAKLAASHRKDISARLWLVAASHFYTLGAVDLTQHMPMWPTPPYTAQKQIRVATAVSWRSYGRKR
ncbi:hypothetical protein ALON55S_06720 [Alishewanella longhuensis]